MMTLAESVVRHAQTSPDRLVYSILNGAGESERLTWGELDFRARRIGQELLLRGLSKKTVLLLFPTGIEYITAFIACLYAGVIAVPIYPPPRNRSERSLKRLKNIVLDCQSYCALTCSTLLSFTQPLLQEISTDLEVIATDTLGERSRILDRPIARLSDIAFLQYTSGSTATPKGVMVTQANLMHNEQLICNTFGHSEESIVVGWLPLYHDMGLIGNVLQPLYCGGSCILIPSLAFLGNPLLWLTTISKYRATTSGAPNSAYDLCVRRIRDHDIASLDLSCWRVAFNGAEPVQAGTLDAFSEKFAPVGFRRTSFFPCYGLAEATLIVSGPELGQPPKVLQLDRSALAANKIALAHSGKKSVCSISCGHALGGQQLVIVDLESMTPCAPEKVGEIWVAGPSITAGYYRDHEKTKETFHATLDAYPGFEFLRTGDLGFVRDGELFVVGRSKDLIILNGRNYYPQDIESLAEECHPLCRGRSRAAFSAPVNGTEGLVMVQELAREPLDSEWIALSTSVREAVSDALGIYVDHFVFVPKGTISKTSSGKIQRYLVRRRFLDGELKAFKLGVEPFESGRSAEIDAPISKDSSGTQLRLYEEIRAELIKLISDRTTKIVSSKPLLSLGLDSMRMTSFVQAIKERYGVSIPIAELFEGGTLDNVVALVERDCMSGPVPAEKGLVFSTFPNDCLSGISKEQESLWFLDKIDPECSRAFHILAPVRVRGGLDYSTTRAALHLIIQRHEPLRTVFRNVKEKPFPEAIDPPEIITRVDLSSLDEMTRKLALSDCAFVLSRMPFQMDEPLLRVGIARENGGDCTLLFIFHHICSDGLSVEIFLREFFSLYNDFLAKRAPTLPPLSCSYSQYVDRQRLEGGCHSVTDLAYWVPKCVSWIKAEKSFHRCAALGSREAYQVPIVVGGETVAAMKACCEVEAVTPFVFLISVFQMFIGTWTGRTQVVTGTSIANRWHQEARKLIGPFTNAVPMSALLESDMSFQYLLQENKRRTAEAITHSRTPFAKIMEAVRQELPSAPFLPFRFVFLYQGYLTAEWCVEGLNAALREDLDTGLSNFDLILSVFNRSPEMVCVVKVRSDFAHREEAQWVGLAFSKLVHDSALRPSDTIGSLCGHHIDRLKQGNEPDSSFTVAITGTFTLQPIEEPLQFWIDRFGIPASIVFSPYNNVVQSLLEVGGPLLNATPGINLVLIRFKDWERSAAGRLGAVAEQFEQFLQALESASGRTSRPFLVFVCPDGGEKSDTVGFENFEDRFKKLAERVQSLRVILPSELQQYYPVAGIYDHAADCLGHVPYRHEFFVAIATFAARHLYSLLAVQNKAIFVDCDNTLWRGICGEDGPDGVIFDSRALALQSVLVRLQQSGKLICLCSKNNEADVFEVFQKRPEMVLKRKDIAAWQINWKPKSENVASLCEQLSISPDSVVFIDDDPVECAAVRAACSAITALQISVGDNIFAILDHAWSLDISTTTREDRIRTRLYQDNFSRDEFRQKFSTSEDFIEALQLQETILPLEADDIPRVSQLTLRTNQFNTTYQRLSEADLGELMRTGERNIWTTRAEDRFGNYGLVGVMLTKPLNETLRLDNWLISCRALGKGLELRMLQWLLNYAAENAYAAVEIPCIVQSRNVPARTFLQSLLSSFRVDDSKLLFRVPTGIRLQQTPLTFESVDDRPNHSVNSSPIERLHLPRLMEEVALYWNNVGSIGAAIRREKTRVLIPNNEINLEPGTPTEELLHKIWCDALQLDRITMTSNFFAIGGHSLSATLLIARIHDAFEIDIPLMTLFRNASIRSLARVIDDLLVADLSNEEISQELDALRSASKHDD